MIGPAYKLHQTANDDKDEVIARTVTGVLDDLRGDAALVLEHHAGTNNRATPVRCARSAPRCGAVGPSLATASGR